MTGPEVTVNADGTVTVRPEDLVAVLRKVEGTDYYSMDTAGHMGTYLGLSDAAVAAVCDRVDREAREQAAREREARGPQPSFAPEFWERQLVGALGSAHLYAKGPR